MNKAEWPTLLYGTVQSPPVRRKIGCRRSFQSPAQRLAQRSIAMKFLSKERLAIVSADQREDPYACPLSASDVANLTPILLIIPKLDVLAEQSFALEARLRAAGCVLARNVYLGATHSFLEAMSIAFLAQQAIHDGASWIRKQMASVH